MFVEISLITIATALVVSKIIRRIKVTDTSTQTEPGLWLPQVAMWLDDSSESELSVLEMEVIKEYISTS